MPSEQSDPNTNSPASIPADTPAALSPPGAAGVILFERADNYAALLRPQSHNALK